VSPEAFDKVEVVDGRLSRPWSRHVHSITYVVDELRAQTFWLFRGRRAGRQTGVLLGRPTPFATVTADKGATAANARLSLAPRELRGCRLRTYWAETERKHA
jgi:hypothetical protein